MADKKSLDNVVNVIAAMLRDAHASHGVVFNTRAMRLTYRKIVSRLGNEGIGFLTKTLARLGKRFDQALTGQKPFVCDDLGCKPYLNTKLPKLFGEFFETIFDKDGHVLHDPDALSVRIVRQLLLPFGKYKLPYTDSQEHEVISAFKKAEEDLTNVGKNLQEIADLYRHYHVDTKERRYHGQRIDFYRDAENDAFRPIDDVVRDSRRALTKLFLRFDPKNITPRHGPGAVATKQRNSGKFRWTNVSSRITELYPFDEYFLSSQGAVCDTYKEFFRIGSEDLSARVLLVPKDSRGPRLISCEPVDFQWIQGGLGGAIVHHVESHYLTKGKVNFTDQNVNRNKALESSITGDYVTLDLKEASDRVHIDLVRLLFPDTVLPYLEACRTLSTELPNGEKLKLNKFAPMGSALCFPILALTVWALLHGAAPNVDTRKRIFVYGDDVIVPRAFARSAITTLESFGLLVNRDKSCCQGFFRESCGMDAFKGIDVTPVRFRTVWHKSPRPDTYCAYISYANAFYDRGWHHTYREICNMLESVFGFIPSDQMSLKRYPSLRCSSATELNFRSRWNRHLQRYQYLVHDVKSKSHLEENVCGWQKLLRYFSEACPPPYIQSMGSQQERDFIFNIKPAFSVSLYTDRRTSLLVKRWR